MSTVTTNDWDWFYSLLVEHFNINIFFHIIIFCSDPIILNLMISHLIESLFHSLSFLIFFVKGPLILSSSDMGTDPRGTVISKVKTTKIPVGSWTDIPIDSSPIEIVVDHHVTAAAGAGVESPSHVDAPLDDTTPTSKGNERMKSEEDSSTTYCSLCGAEKKFEFQVTNPSFL
jgi:hypothetical protein